MKMLHEKSEESELRVELIRKMRSHYYENEEKCNMQQTDVVPL